MAEKNRDSEHRLTLPALRESFAALKEWLERLFPGMAVPPDAGKKLLIAADEIFTNAASYAYPTGTAGTVEVTVESDPARTEITLTFSDSGIAYNPLDAPPPDLGKPLAEREPGGLGIFLVKRLTDAQEYRRENGRNILVLKKKMR